MPDLTDTQTAEPHALTRKWRQASAAARLAEHHFPADCLAEAADVLDGIPEGWRPPARVIESIEELNTLAEGVVVLDARQIVQEVDLVNEVGTYRACWWISPGSEFSRPSEAVALPATVLHIPTQEGQADA